MKNKKHLALIEIKNYIAIIFVKAYIRCNNIKITSVPSEEGNSVILKFLKRSDKDYVHVDNIKADDYKKMKLTAVIEEDESGFYCRQIKEFPRVLSQGKTQAELLENLKDALKLFFEYEIAQAGKKVSQDNTHNMDEIDKVIKPFKLNKKEEKLVFEIIENMGFKKVMKK